MNGRTAFYLLHKRKHEDSRVKEGAMTCAMRYLALLVTFLAYADTSTIMKFAQTHVIDHPLKQQFGSIDASGTGKIGCCN